MSRVFVSTTIGLFELISEASFMSPFAYVCSKLGVSFNTSMWMDHTNFQKLGLLKGSIGVSSDLTTQMGVTKPNLFISCVRASISLVKSLT